MENRRRSRRIPVATVANITPSGVQATTEVLVHNLSTEGMGCSGNRLYSKGDVLIIKIKLETSIKEIIEEKITGRVVWTEKRRAKPDHEKKYAFGIKFRELETLNPRLYATIQELGGNLFPS